MCVWVQVDVYAPSALPEPVKADLIALVGADVAEQFFAFAREIEIFTAPHAASAAGATDDSHDGSAATSADAVAGAAANGEQNTAHKHRRQLCKQGFTFPVRLHVSLGLVILQC